MRTLTAVALGATMLFAAPAEFEVVSVKLIGESDSLPSGFSTVPHRSGGRIHWITNPYNLVRYAYHVPAWRIGGINLMVSVEPFYVIDAKTDESATEDQIRSMLQSLLTERLKLIVHWATKEQNGLALVQNGKRPKIRPVKAGEEAPDLPEYFRGKPKATLEGSVLLTAENGMRAITGRRVTIAKLADALQDSLRTFVHDETGLAGDYYFALMFVPDDSPKDVVGPSIFAAVQEELGLRLEKRKGTVEVLVIDHLEKMPSGN
jgi:uncharacterized protein (TIGR03435 family)